MEIVLGFATKSNNALTYLLKNTVLHGVFVSKERRASRKKRGDDICLVPTPPQLEPYAPMACLVSVTISSIVSATGTLAFAMASSLDSAVPTLPMISAPA